MNRQRWATSLLLVLMLLVMGSLMLKGMNRLYQSRLAQVTLEVQALNATVEAESLLQWGRSQPWAVTPLPQCRQAKAGGGRVCLRGVTPDRVLLIAGQGAFLRWLSGRIEQQNVLFNEHGWSDFCPLKEVSLCQLP